MNNLLTSMFSDMFETTTEEKDIEPEMPAICPFCGSFAKKIGDVVVCYNCARVVE